MVEETRLANIGYHFDIAQAGDVIYMLIRAAETSKRGEHDRDEHHIHMVLRCQADAIRQGLHLREPCPDFMADIEDFHQRFGLSYDGKPRSLATEKMDDEGETLFDFRLKFMREELDEYEREQVELNEAVGRGDEGGVATHLEDQLDALVDLLYVAFGTLYLQFGRAATHEAWRRVHHANMLKVRAQSGDESSRGSKFDVVKPKGWVPPDHRDLVEDHAHTVYRHPGPVMDPGSANSDTRSM